MALTSEEQVREMARLVAIPLAAEEVSEVTNRLNALLDALESLLELDLEGVQPFIVPEEEVPGGR